MLKKEGVQGTNYYWDEQVEKWRYNPYRKKNRELAERAYKENEHLPFPLHLIVEVSSLCNLKCGFCNREVMTRPQRNMSFSTFKKVVDQAVAGGVYSLSLYCLGEPFLNPDLPEMVAYAKLSGVPYVDVSTNGMFDMTPVLGTGLNELIISLDGFKENHEANRPGADYDRIVKNLVEFKEEREYARHRQPFIRVQVIEHFVKDRLAEFIDYWACRADVVYVKNLEVFSHTLGDKNTSAEEIACRLKNRKPCKQLWFCLTVNADGNIAGCCHDSHGRSVLGNLDNMLLREAWDKMGAVKGRHSSGNYSDFGGLCNRCTDWSW